MRPRPILLAVLALGSALLGAPAVARAQDSPDRVRLALEVTDRRIEQADALVAGSDDARAQVELAAATDLQGRAWNAFRGAMYGFSGRLTLEARGHADRAIAIVRGLPDPDRVRAQLERTRELLERARERVEECSHDRARSIMATALSMQARAEEAERAGRYLAALQLSMSARERGLRALRLCNLEEDRAEAAARALDRTDAALRRAQDAVEARPSEAARAALDRALRVQDQARSEYRAEHWEASLRLTQSARALAFRSLRLSGRGA